MKERENTAVSGKDAVAIVPRIRILNRVGVHVPAVGIPVHIHGTQLSY